MPRSRGERLLLAAEGLEVELEVERSANEAYEHYRGERARQAGSAAGRVGHGRTGRPTCPLGG